MMNDADRCEIGLLRLRQRMLSLSDLDEGERARLQELEAVLEREDAAREAEAKRRLRFAAHGEFVSDAAPKPKPKHPNPDSLFRAIEARDLEARDLEARAAERLDMTVERYRELMDDDPR